MSTWRKQEELEEARRSKEEPGGATKPESRPGQAKTGPMTLSLLGLHQHLQAIRDQKKIGPMTVHLNGKTMLGMQAVQHTDQLVTAKRQAVK